MKITWYGCSCFRFGTILPCRCGAFPGIPDAAADEFVAETKGHNVVVPKAGRTLAV
jgi:hypothetical protein